MFDRLPEDTQTLYAELLALLVAHEAERGWSHLAGSFVAKTVGHREYVYFQYSDPGGHKRQFSIGPRSQEVDGVIDRYRKERRNHAADIDRIERLARLLRTAGLATLPHHATRVVAALADAGVFRLGGVLVGTYAFLLLGNSLGVHWPEAAWKTEDIDLAGVLQLATPALAADVPKALDSLQMGFVPVPRLDPRQPSTSFKVRGAQLRVDLLTPSAGASSEPVLVPRFKAMAAPLKFLSLVMEGAQPASAVGGSATLVLVPDPARFALHKALVSQTRSVAQQTKGTKDLHQTALLLEVLAEDRPDDLEQAAGIFAKAGPTVFKKVNRALGLIEKRFPEAAAAARIVKPLLPGA